MNYTQTDKYKMAMNDKKKQKQRELYPQFWTESVTAVKKEYKGVAIDKSLLLDFLGDIGLKKYNLQRKHKGVYIYKADRFWEMVNEEAIKDIAIKAIKIMFYDYEHVGDVINKLNGVNNPFKAGFLSGLRNIERMNYIIDTEYKSHNYYKNGIVIVGRNGVSITGYDDVDGDIWLDSVIDRDFPIEHHTNLGTHTDGYSSLVGMTGNKSSIELFLRNITEDDKTYDAVKSSIGYMMHRHKIESQTKLFSLTDTDFDADASGGNGKSLVSKILGQVRNVHTINHDVGGKMKEFVFAGINEDVDIIFHDEFPKGFKLQRLFSAITGDLTVEKKGKDIFTIPFSDAPKHMSASNHPFKGTGGSFSGRLNEIQINHYYERDKKQPRDDFGFEFFVGGFSSSEWRLFDAFMVDCLIYFLNNGIVNATNKSIARAKLVENTNEGFVDFINGKIGELVDFEAQRFTAKTFISNFVAAQDNITHLNSGTVHKWIKEWCKSRGIEFKKGRETAGKRINYIQVGGRGSFKGDFKGDFNDVWSEFSVHEDAPY